jgi:serine/threonine-protein kinase
MSRICQRCQHENADEAKFCLQCGNLLELEASAGEDPLIGKVLLSRYRVVRLLGEGGMGKVYLAEQKMGTATRKVAIKTLHSELGGDSQLVARFHRECETVVELGHPNTVQFYDFGEMGDGTLFIVMEYIEGESLADVLHRGPLEPARADRILIQIAGSLHEAHQRGVVHRDLKPDNILLSERGGQQDFVKVLDFGIAKRNEGDDGSQAKLTQQGMVLGTPPYMSPEQFSGQSLDARSDIYSLGVMTYEMTTARLPFDATTPWEWATKHLTAEPNPLESHPAGSQLPEHKRQAVHCALQKDPEHRFGTVLEFMHAFTGMHDPQVAWTLATTPGGLGSQPGQPGAAQARPPVGTPQPMPQQAGTEGAGAAPPGNEASAYAPTGHATPQPSAVTPPSGASQEAGGPPPKTGSDATDDASTVAGLPTRTGRLVTTLLVLLFVLGGGAAGATWYWTQQGDTQDEMAAKASGAGAEPSDTAAEGPEGDRSAGEIPSTPEPDERARETAGQQPRSDTTGSDSAREQDRAERKPPANDERSTGPQEETEPQADTDEPQADAKRRRRQARLAQARTALRKGESALGSGKLRDAIAALGKAQRLLGGRNHGLVKELKGQLARRGSNQVGILMQQGRCDKAQALYRRLRAVGAHRPSAVHFSDDWCAKPR